MKRKKQKQNQGTTKQKNDVVIIKNYGMEITTRKYPNDTPENCTRSCIEVCSFANVCHLMMDPRNPGNKNSSFMDFCEDEFGDDFYPILVERSDHALYPSPY